MKIVKVNNLPQTYEADTIYLVKSSTAGLMDIYVTDSTGLEIRALPIDVGVIATLLPRSEVGVTAASLVGGKVPIEQLPSAILGALSYKGTWDASINIPAIPTASGTNKGWYYVVSVSGATNINGGTDWVIGDWIVSDGTAWGKVDNSDRVSSVAGKTGVVNLAKADVGLGNVDNTSDADKPISTATQNELNAKQDTLVSGTSIKTINGTSVLGSGDLVVEGGAGISFYTYDDRSTLRTTAADAGDLALVDGLGLFIFDVGSDEPDDDESCFATATGRWLLQAVHWDVVDAWQLPEVEERNEYDEDEPQRWAAQAADAAAAAAPAAASAEFAASFASKVLTGTAASAITSVAAVSQVSFTGTVTGAAVGDRVIATPPDALGACIAAYARVTATNTVTVYLNNPSAAFQTLVAGTWQITVIKS